MKDIEHLLSSEENAKRLQESITQLKVSENIELCEEDTLAVVNALEHPKPLNEEALKAVKRYKDVVENTFNVQDILATLAAPTLGFGCRKDVSFEEVVWFCEEVKRLQGEFVKP